MLLVTAGVAQATPCPEHVLGTAQYYEVGGTTLRQYSSDGTVASENDREPRTLWFGAAKSTSAFVSGASKAGARFLFDALDLDVDNPDGTRTLTLGIGPAGTRRVLPLHITVRHSEVPIDLNGNEIVTVEQVAGTGTVLRAYRPYGPHRVLAVYPASLPAPGNLPLLQYEGALRFRADDITFPFAYGNDRLYTVAGSGEVVSARPGGTFSPVYAPDGGLADRVQVSADGVAVVRTAGGSYWRIDRGLFTPLPAAWFAGMDDAFSSRSAGALAPGGLAIALGVSAPRPTVPTQVITVDLTTGARHTFDLLDATLPSVGGVAYSVRQPGELYLLRTSHPISIHSPVTTQLQSLDLGSGAVTPIGSAMPEWWPRLYSADVG